MEHPILRTPVKEMYRGHWEEFTFDLELKMYIQDGKYENYCNKHEHKEEHAHSVVR